MRYLVFAISLLLVPGTSAAVSSFFSGGDLFKQCGAALEATDRSAAQQSLCYGYVSGVLDGITVTLDSFVVEAEYLCIPKGLITAEDVAGIFFDYLSAHPEQRDAAASSVVLVSMREAFPCGDRQQSENLEKHLRDRGGLGGGPIFIPRSDPEYRDDGR